MGRPKPLASVTGRPMLERTLQIVRDAGVDRIVVVLGDHAADVRARVDLDGTTVVENPRFKDGMSSSLRSGVRAVGASVRNVMTILGDQPFVSPTTVRALVRRAESGDGAIFIPTYKGVWGNPVVFDASLAPELDRLQGDVGCRGLFPRHSSEIREVPVDDPGILVDIDTEAELAGIESSLARGEPLGRVLDRVAAPRWSLHAAPKDHPLPKRLLRGPDIDGIARELRAQRVPFALATVVRTVRPTSGRPGYKAIVREDGSHVGWVGGACTEHTLVTEARRALAEGSSRVLRVAPNPLPESEAAEGVVERPMSCQSGGTVEIFIEPNLPKPNLVIVGDSPVATSLAVLAPVLGYRVVMVAPGADPTELPDVDAVVGRIEEIGPHLTPDAFVVVASMGKYDESALAPVARSSVAFAGLVASRKRAASVFAALREEGVPREALARIHNPVGLDIAASTPEEIALSILAELVRERRKAAPRPAAPAPSALAEAPAIDPVCHMEVERTSPLTATHAGTTFYFCSDSCRRKFSRSPSKYLVAK